MEQLPNTSPEDNVDASPEVAIGDTNPQDNLDNTNSETVEANTSRTKKVLESIGGVALSAGRDVLQTLFMTPEQRYRKHQRDRLEEEVQQGTISPQEADRQASEYARSMRTR